jgi:hypothetical protein
VVPETAGEIVATVSDGILALRVVDARNKQPIGNATIAWRGSGAQVEAVTNANGEALLEGLAAPPAFIAVNASAYQRLEVKITEAPATLQELSMLPVPTSRIRARVVNAAGHAVANAVVELATDDPYERTQIATTDTKGMMTFAEPPIGVLRLTASARDLVPATVAVTTPDEEVVLRLTSGFRVMVRTERPETSGTHVVRVVDHSGASVDALLDAASDRTASPNARLSLGPLPAGNFVVELHGARGVTRHAVSIVDRNVEVVIRDAP